MSNCRKYDEGSFISFRKPETILTDAIWRIESYEVNGVDSTSYILNNPNYGDLQFKDDGKKGTSEGTFSGGSFSGVYRMISKEKIHIDGNDTLAITKNVLFVRETAYQTLEFHITYLSHKYFRLKIDYFSGGYTYNHNNYYIKFKNVK